MLAEPELTVLQATANTAALQADPVRSREILSRIPANRWGEPGDLEGAWLVQTATGDPDVDGRVADDAEARQIWCLKGGDPDHATAWAPAASACMTRCSGQ